MAAYCYRRNSVVCLSVCWSRSWPLQKRLKPIEMPFGELTRGPKEPLLDGGLDRPRREVEIFGCFRPIQKHWQPRLWCSLQTQGLASRSRLPPVRCHMKFYPPWNVRPCDAVFCQNFLTTCCWSRITFVNRLFFQQPSLSPRTRTEVFHCIHVALCF